MADMQQPHFDPELVKLVLQLTDANTERREQALTDLSKQRESFPDLAPMLWHSCGTIAALLQEIISIYPALSPPTLSVPASNRVCNALALLQCVASHPETRQLFLQGAWLAARGGARARACLANFSGPPSPSLALPTGPPVPPRGARVPLFLYPFLSTSFKIKPFEYLRLTSLGVIGALVKVDDDTVVSFLLATEIIPLCLRIMETGSELSRTVATFIVQKILLDDGGLAYICQTADRFFAVSQVLSNMVALLVDQAPGQSFRLLKHIIRCYLRLADNPKAKEALRQVLPQSLQDLTFARTLEQDRLVPEWLDTLRRRVFPDQHTH